MINKMINKDHKRGLLKTLEVFLAIVIGFVFLTTILPKQSFNVDEKPSLGGLLLYDNIFRNAVLSNNITLIKERINSRMSVLYSDFGFNVSVSQDPNDLLYFDDKDVFSEAIFIVGNETLINHSIVRLYYWKR